MPRNLQVLLNVRCLLRDLGKGRRGLSKVGHHWAGLVRALMLH